MEHILKVTLLYDFYGELLTKKQKQVYELYYQNDLSFSEIAEELHITRQGVRDQLLRTEKHLIEYEAKLQLVNRFLKQQQSIQEAKQILLNLYTHSEMKQHTEAFDELIHIMDTIVEFS